MSNADGEPDVNDFLMRIKELGNKRDQEDEDRTRKLEEEILQGRKERRARRAGNYNSFVFIFLDNKTSLAPPLIYNMIAHFSFVYC